MDRYNSEGYPDPTAYGALSIIEREEKARQYFQLVYIASPFAEDIERNIAKTQGYCKFALSRGCMPLAPHLHYPQFMDDDDEVMRELGIRFALILLEKCDELWAFSGYVSDGMRQEISKAKRRGMTVRYFNSKCEEVSPYGD